MSIGITYKNYLPLVLFAALTNTNNFDSTGVAIISAKLQPAFTPEL